MRGFCNVFWTNYDYICFVTVEFEKIVLHPGFNVCQTLSEGGVDTGVYGCGGDVKLNVVSITMKTETMMTDDITKGKNVEDKEERTKHRTLGNTLRERGYGGGAAVDVDELLPICEVGLEP